jgi:hypothetical protein
LIVALPETLPQRHTNQKLTKKDKKKRAARQQANTDRFIQPDPLWNLCRSTWDAKNSKLEFQGAKSRDSHRRTIWENGYGRVAEADGVTI